MLGAVVALLSGVVHPGDIPVVWQIVWNATATFIAIIIISPLLDEAGFFEWAALHVARWGGGHGRMLFALIVLLGASVSALFANDGAALILTPIVMAMLLALGFSAAATLAFVMAAGLIADLVSLPLIVSNLVNIASVVPQLGVATDATLHVVPIYIAFSIIAPLIGWNVGRLFHLDAKAGRSVAFSAGTRNSLVILPLAFAVPGAVPVLPAIIVTQTLVELVGELIYVRFIGKLGASPVARIL